MAACTGCQGSLVKGDRRKAYWEDHVSSQVVHVVDDDSEVLQALAFLLTASGFAVQVHNSAAAFLGSDSRNEAGCVVTDVRMPGMDGLELQRRLVAEGSNVPVIVMTGHADVALAVEAMKAGAVDFIEKPFDNQVLVGAVRSALARQNNERERDLRTAEIRNRLESLSERERQVLDGLVAGKSNKIIAFDLNLSTRTVEGYRAGVMAKMQAHSLSALIRMALSLGS
jgi:two-component system response regulator FixJ